MANRHLSRSVVIQSLFEWDFNGKDNEKLLEVLDRNQKKFASGLDEQDRDFMKNLAEMVVRKQKTIDDIIEKAAPDWPIEKISTVDRNILRLGLTELLFGDRKEVPPKVAINEAIELAKTFGGDKSGKFVNGVLGAVYKEIGEPGKHQTGKKKKKKIDKSKLPLKKLVGAVVYAEKDDSIYFAMVHDVFGYWTLSKGKLKENEKEEDGVVRKVKEEIGIKVDVQKKLGENEYIASHPEKGKIRKNVAYFLTKTNFQELELAESGGLDDARWFPMEDVPELKMYDDIVTFTTKAIKIITEE